ncbi:MAG TPA: adenylosuccinate synthase [Hydrogenophaga sp.]
MTHADLCALAVKWLKRPQSGNGHGCSIAVSECQSGCSGEIPDAIGFRANWAGGSVVVEVKVSRSDFLADKAKPHRQPGRGMGTWRYYMAPEGLIKPEELPERWGLLEVNKRGHVKPRAGAVLEARHYTRFSDALEAFRHVPDHNAERDLLVLLLARVGDPNQVADNIKAANNLAAHAKRLFEREREEHKKTQTRNWELYARINELEAAKATETEPLVLRG